MGVLDKFKDWVGLGAEYDDDYEEVDETYEPAQETERQVDNVSPYSAKRNNVYKVHASADMKLFICEPEKYEDCIVAVDELKNKKAVVLNIESLSIEEQKNIFEFIKGAVYALESSIQKVSTGIFVIAPNNVQIDGKRTARDIREKNII